MYYTNTLTITMSNSETATKALNALVNRLEAGFECDNTYNYNPATKMGDALALNGNTIILPDEFGAYTPFDANSVMPELAIALATAFANESFLFEAWSSNDYTDSDFEAHYENGILKIKNLYYPNGYIEYFCCDSCCEELVKVADYEADKKYYCPCCDEEHDFSEMYEEIKPVVTEKKITIK